MFNHRPDHKVRSLAEEAQEAGIDLEQLQELAVKAAGMPSATAFVVPLANSEKKTLAQEEFARNEDDGDDLEEFLKRELGEDDASALLDDVGELDEAMRMVRKKRLSPMERRKRKQYRRKNRARIRAQQKKYYKKNKSKIKRRLKKIVRKFGSWSKYRAAQKKASKAKKRLSMEDFALRTAYAAICLAEWFDGRDDEASRNLAGILRKTSELAEMAADGVLDGEELDILAGIAAYGTKVYEQARSLSESVGDASVEGIIENLGGVYVVVDGAHDLMAQYGLEEMDGMMDDSMPAMDFEDDDDDIEDEPDDDMDDLEFDDDEEPDDDEDDMDMELDDVSMDDLEEAVEFSSNDYISEMLDEIAEIGDGFDEIDDDEDDVSDEELGL